MKLRPEQLADSVATSLGPVYLLSGDETLLLNDSADTLRRACRSAGYAERVVLNAERGFDWQDFEAELNGLSLFNDRRLIELRLATAKPGKKGQEALVRACQRPAEDTVLMITAPKLDKTAQKSAWVAAAEASGVFVQVWPVDDGEFPGWVAARLRSRGLEPDRDAVLALCARAEGNLLAAAQEIDKLWLTNGEGPIAAATVVSEVGDNARFNVFKLADTTLAGNQRKAFRVLRSLRLEGAEPVLVVWALGREIRALYTLRHAIDDGADTAGAMRQARVWGVRQKLVRAALARHDRQSLTALLRASELADRAARGRARIGAWDHITGLVFGLTGSSSAILRGAA